MLAAYMRDTMVYLRKIWKKWFGLAVQKRNSCVFPKTVQERNSCEPHSGLERDFLNEPEVDNPWALR